MIEFVKWEKIHRFHRDWEITEKVDGTNGILLWHDEYHPEFCLGVDSMLNVASGEETNLYLYAGSRTRWLTLTADNHGFAKWAAEWAPFLAALGKGRHFGEWYGSGIQRGYGMSEKRFALFDVNKYGALPPGVDIVPLLGRPHGSEINSAIVDYLAYLREEGSHASRGFDRPEGIVVRHTQSGDRFKVLLEGDEIPKSVFMTGVGDV